MKRTFSMLLVLFSLYLALQFVTKLFSKGHYVEYTVENFIVKETFKNQKNNSKYYIEISDENSKYYFQTYYDFTKADTIVKNIKYKEVGNYKCLLPIFYNNKKLFDITCLNNGVAYNYADLIGKNLELDNWVNSISDVYLVANFKDENDAKETFDKVTVFKDNLIKKVYIGIENYRGLETINKINLKSYANVSIFDKDKYKRPIAGFSEQYYITADYTKDFSFSVFNVINMIDNKTTTIKSDKEFSFNSYIMGSYEQSFYLYDKDAKKQYQINLKTKKIIEVGNIDLGLKVYVNGEFAWVKIEDLKEDLYFDNLFYKTQTAPRVDWVNGESGETYTFIKNGNLYDVYKNYNGESNYKTLIFKTDNITDVIYIEDYVFYRNGDSIYYYKDSTGVRKVYTNSELKFNDDIKFGVYIDN